MREHSVCYNLLKNLCLPKTYPRKGEGTQGAGGQAGSGARPLSRGRTRIGEGGKAGGHQPPERLGGALCPSFGGTGRQGTPWPEPVKAGTCEGSCRPHVDAQATGMARWLLGFVARRELLVFHHSRLRGNGKTDINEIPSCRA